MTDQHQAQPTIDTALAALAAVGSAMSAYDRPDLAQRLEDKAASLRNPSFHVLVVGEFKQGKSSLLNALVSRGVCPVDDDIATAVPTVVRWSEEPSAEVLFQPADASADDAATTRELIEFDDVSEYAVERDVAGRPVHSVEIGVPSRLLAGGLVLVDTPGVGGLGSTHGAVTASAIPMAEAVIFVTDASQEFTAPELEFMEATRKLCPNTLFLMTKTDFYPAWRKIRDLNEGHLTRLGISAPIIPTSAVLHQRAITSGDAKLLGESGFPELVSFIRKEVLGSAVQLSVAAAARDLHDVLDQLTTHYAARKAVLEDPETAQENLRELERAKERADELRSRAARWNVTLSDGIQDLTGDVDHDLRERFRNISQEGEDALGNSDPGEIWNEFEPWLYSRTSIEVVRNYELLQQRARELVERVAEHFETESEEAAVDLHVIDPSAALTQAQGKASLDVEEASGQVFTGVRSGLGGAMMFGMLGRFGGPLASLALGPIGIIGGIGLGLVMARKGIRDDKARVLTQQQTQARAAQRKYLDEATFRTSKESRDALRSIQRQIRDHFTTRAEEQAKSLQETVMAVQAEARTDEQERSSRLAEVNTELERLTTLRRQVDALGPTVSNLGSRAPAT